MSKKRHQNRGKDQARTIQFRPGSHAGESLVEEGGGSTKITVTAYDASAVHHTKIAFLSWGLELGKSLGKFGQFDL